MSLWRQLRGGFRVLGRRSAADEDLSEEVELYLREATDDLVSRGVEPAEAARSARMAFGNALLVREEVRAAGWENLLATFLSDLRFAARRLRKDPAFTGAAALTLAVGIGASTAIFSAVNPILFEPLPYPHPQRILMMWDHTAEGVRLEATFGTYRELVARSHSFVSLAVMKTWQPTMTGPAEPERLEGQSVSTAYFRVLGVAPAVGRDFRDSDDRPDAPLTVILSDRLWRSRFHADPSIVGQQITLDENRCIVAGVMPPDFENVLAPAAALWKPLRYDPSLPLQGREWGHHLRLVGRLRGGVPTDAAARELDAIARAPIREFARAPWARLDRGLTLIPLREDVIRGVKPALLAVLGAVLLVLAVACVNVTNLLLARGAQRKGEFAMRAALGAGRSRMIRQLLTESLLLSFVGGALGMAVAKAGVRTLLALAPPGLPRVGSIRVDGAVFAFGFAATAVLGLLFGLLPALHASSSSGELRAGVQQGFGRTTASQWTRRTLVVAEVALALVLLAGAGLLLRSVQRLFAVSPGFAPSGLLTMQVQTSGRRFDDASTRRFFREALRSARDVPGVTSASLTSQLPLSGDFDVYGVHFESKPAGHGDAAFRYAVTPGYFQTMGIPLRRGRLLDDRDVAGAPGAVVINESFARREFPGREPIGERVRIGPEDGPWQAVVGVVGDVKQVSLATEPRDAFYVTMDQWPAADGAMSLVVRAKGSAASLAPAIRAAVWSVDKDQPVVRVATMEALLEVSAAERRFALVLFEAFAVAALVLAAVGIYGVISGGVAERLREIGLRSALGASHLDILGLVLREGMSLTAFGVAVGLAGAAAASRGLSTLLFGVSPLDPKTYLAVTLVLAAVAVAACAGPAWRASRIDPSITLRD